MDPQQIKELKKLASRLKQINKNLERNYNNEELLEEKSKIEKKMM